MKFGLKALLTLTLVVAISFAFLRPSLWRLNASLGVNSLVRTGVRSRGYPVIDAIGYFDGGTRILVLRRVTSAEFDDGEVVRPGSHAPDWLDTRSFGDGRIFDCVVDGRRVSIDDDVQIFYATDGEKPKYARLKYSDYASLDNVGFLETNQAMWNLAVEHTEDAEP